VRAGLFTAIKGLVKLNELLIITEGFRILQNYVADTSLMVPFGEELAKFGYSSLFIKLLDEDNLTVRRTVVMCLMAIASTSERTQLHSFEVELTKKLRELDNLPGKDDETQMLKQDCKRLTKQMQEV